MKSVLILEDDLETLSIIFKVLSKTNINLAPIVFSTYEQVEKNVNPNDMKFDLILLDRDCFLGGSFHVLDIEKFGPEKIIGISSVPQYNIDLQRRGVTHIITKDYQNLEKFSQELFNEISLIIQPQS